MKQTRFLFNPAIVLLVAATLAHATPPEHEFSVRQYNEFHEVLHPLQHDALPKGDFALIRARSGELLKHGRAIVKLGVPPKVKAERKAEFKQELRKFNQALIRFKADVKKDNNDELKASYSAVHDSFEMLAALLPR